MAALGATVSASPFAASAPELIALGYHPLPIMPKEKRPGEFRSGAWRGMGQWQRFRDRAPTQFELKLWMSNFPASNIGVVLGSPVAPGLYLIGIDVDAPDFDDAETIVRSLPRTPMRKKGAKGETRFYLADKSITSKPYNRASDRIRLVDVLTGFDTRQTVVPPSIHPDTGAPYIWLDGPVAAVDLPIFTADHLTELEETLETLGWNPAAEKETHGLKVARAAPEAVDEDDFFAETKRAALANLDAWVPQLDLYGLTRSGDRYRSVASFRPSLAGKPLEKRNLHLAIHPAGIKDWGTDQGYSAIDLVMAVRGVEQAEATSWLRDRLGLNESAVVIALQPRLTTGGVEHDADGVVIEAEPVHQGHPFEELPDVLTRVPGLVGEIVDWIVGTAPRPQRGLSLGAALTILGTAAGRKYATPTRSGTHLYVLALAPTGAGKDHPQEMAIKIMTDGGMERLLGGQQFMSFSAVINRVVRQPLTLCVQDEFGGFLARVFAKGSSGHEKAISDALRTMWGKAFKTYISPEYAHSHSEVIHGPALSIYGSSTPEEFYRALNGEAISNGFLNRFMLIASNAKVRRVTPKLDVETVPDRILTYLARVHQPINTLAAATMGNGRPGAPAVIVPWFDERAQRIYDDLAEALDDRTEHREYYMRTAEMAQRLATIRAIGLSADAPAITTEDMVWGRDLAMWSTRTMVAQVSDYMADNPHEAEAKRVLRKIRELGRVSKRDLLRALGTKMKGRDLDDILKSHLDAELIAMGQTTPPSGGTPTKWYWPL
ncbi:MAG TPA: bifunctional DNA primase/polymerase [Caulobacteraceae bacterium]|jgi:hypothetical protein|nr:bifunctional DNA primase/polymerase [Caulobacteraceae bacterium]